MVSIASGSSTPISVGDSPLKGNEDRTNAGASSENSGISPYSGRQRHKAQDPGRDISIQVLEKFSLVTRFARETTSQLFRETHSNGFDAAERKSHEQNVQGYSHEESTDTEKVADEVPVAADPLEVTFCLTIL